MRASRFIRGYEWLSGRRSSAEFRLDSLISSRRRATTQGSTHELGVQTERFEFISVPCGRQVHGMISRSLGHRAPLLWIVIPMMAGLVLGSTTAVIPVSGALGIAGAALVLAGCSLRPERHHQLLGAVVAAGMCAGYISYHLNNTRLPAWQTLPPREVRVGLEVTRIFPQPDAKRVSGFGTIVITDPHLRELIGHALYFSLQLAPGEIAPLRSAQVSAIGVLIAVPATVTPGSFDAYLASAGIHFRLSRGRILDTLTSASRYRVFCQQGLDHFSRLLSVGVDAKRPELTAVLRAMLLGQKHELSDEQGTSFMRSGTMHLFAISGLHISVIAVGLQALLTLVRLPPSFRFTVGMGALWLYVDITGGAPSAVRAFIMVVLFELARSFRKPGNPLSALAASAFIVILVWPLQIFSASFQMSYGIVAALLLLGLPLAAAWQERWSWFRLLPKATWRWYHHRLDAFYREATSALAIGLATTLVSTLAGLHYFQLLTPVALLANLVLIPASGVVILSGFASLLAGLAGMESLSSLFNHSSVLVLAIIDFVVQIVVALPGAWSVATFNSAWIGPAAHLALGAALVFGYQSHWARHCGSWWPPFVIVALVLLMGVDYTE